MMIDDGFEQTGGSGVDEPDEFDDSPEELAGGRAVDRGESSKFRYSKVAFGGMDSYLVAKRDVVDHLSIGSRVYSFEPVEADVQKRYRFLAGSYVRTVDRATETSGIYDKLASKLGMSNGDGFVMVVGGCHRSGHHIIAKVRPEWLTEDFGDGEEFPSWLVRDENEGGGCSGGGAKGSCDFEVRSEGGDACDDGQPKVCATRESVSDKAHVVVCDVSFLEKEGTDG